MVIGLEDYENIVVELLVDSYTKHLLTVLRDRKTPSSLFREALEKLGEHEAIKLLDEMGSLETRVETPTGGYAVGTRLLEMEKTVVIAILRAAIPMLNGILNVIPEAKIGFIAARRVEENGMKPNFEFDIEINYVKIPEIKEDNTVVIVDPMIATASTMEHILMKILEHGRGRKYFILSAITTTLALKKINEYAGNLGLKIKLYTAAVDPVLNDKGYIVPGLGDAGDRAFKT